MKFFRKIRTLFRRRKLDSEMAEELRAHLEQQTEHNLAAGMSPEEARAAAQRQFGGVEQIKERARDQRGLVWLEHALRDVRYAFRSLVKSPSFAVTAVLTLALGIGVNAALFTVYNIVALRSLPVRDPDALVKIAGQRKGAFYPGFSYAEYLGYRDGNHVLSGLVAVNEAQARLSGSESLVRDPLFQGRDRDSLPVQFVSDNYFSVLGGEMALGRGFLPEENRSPGAAPVVVLSHLFWTRQLNGDPNVIGRTLTFSGRTFTVIGVTSPEFVGQQPAPPAAWLPLMMWGRPADYGPKGMPTFRLIGRLLPGVTMGQVKADFDLIATRLETELPNPEAKDSVRLERGMRFVDIPLDAKTLAATTPLLLGFALVLVIACTNVANLLLARGVTRQHEIGVRLTLGAGRGRVIRQLLTENLLLCAVGAVVGLALALWTLQILQPIILGRLPAEWGMEVRRWYFLKMTPDWHVAAFTGFLTVVAVLAAGLLPALHASGTSLVSHLKNEGTLFGRRLRQSRLRSLLVVAQVAVCLMLLSCAGLLARNLFALRHADVGFDPGAVFLVNAAPKAVPADRQAAALAAVATLNGLPGVAAASLGSDAPLLGRSATTVLVRTDGGTGPGGAMEKMKSFAVGANFFPAFGLKLRRGRGFEEADVRSGARIVVVSESLAKRLWPGQEAVGRTIGVSEAAFSGGPWTGAVSACEVIGVAPDVTSQVYRDTPEIVYLPLLSTVASSGVMFLRPRSPSAAAWAEIVQAADAAGLTLRVDRRLADYYEEQVLPFFGAAVLSGALGGLALLMASVGLYGVMAFGVNQRVREIGIRVALGATAKKVIGLFLRQGMGLVAVGIALGLGGGALFALMLRKILPGLPEPFDPLAFGGVTLVFTLVALLACWLPARRAAKVDPMVALRAE
ncbi:MAG TPA: ABC transporter permease [Opitutaceae bacterium]|nr:ABC transporter permease [Opitutaceae bacterium]